MIQRKQTLWLLLAAVCTGLTFKFPFYIAPSETPGETTNIMAQSAIYSTITGIITGVLCLAAIFMYKNLRAQVWLTVLAILLALLHIVLLYAQGASYSKGSPALTATLPVLAVVFLVLAGQGINSDIKTLQEMRSNRLR